MNGNADIYTAYGLRISSPIRLPGLRRANGNPDVTIIYGCLDAEASDRRDSFRVVYDGIGTFEITNGRRVVVDPEGEGSDAALQPYLLGPVLGAVLHQRGHLVLHASSVSINGAAVVFVGPSGAGKSTTAAACVARGHDLLCDDITAVEFTDGTPAVVPGFPALKLTPELAETFGIGREGCAPAAGEKKLFRVSSGVPDRRRPLNVMFVLADGELHIEEMSPSDSLQALIGHTYTQSLLDEDSIRLHFRQCTSLAESIAVTRLSLPRDLDVLSDAVARIEDEIGK